MTLTQLEQTESELKRRKDGDITNQWQFHNYLIFFIGPSTARERGGHGGHVDCFPSGLAHARPGSTKMR